MSKAEILAELPKLTADELAEIQTRLDELTGNDWIDADDGLTDAEKALVEARIETHEKNPETAFPWEEFDVRLKRRLGDGELADADKLALDAALTEYQKNPDAGSTWEDVKARITAKLRR